MCHLFIRESRKTKVILLFLFLALIVSFMFVNPKTGKGAFSWSQGNGPYGARVWDLAIDPSGVVYAGTLDSGVYKTTNGASSWSARNNNLGSPEINAVAVESTSNIYLGTGGYGSGPNFGIFKSTNAGDNWSISYNTAAEIQSLTIDYSTGSVYGGCRNSAILKSTNNGANWTQTSITTGTVTSLAVETSQNIYAGSAQFFNPGANAGVYKSTDAGASWYGTGLTTENINYIYVDDPLPAVVYACTANDGLYKSTNEGANWEKVTSCPTGYVARILKDTSDNLYLGGGGGIWKSTNDGNNWNAIWGINDSEVNDLISENDNTFYVGTNIAIYKTTNAGNSWQKVVNKIMGASITSFTENPGSDIYAGGQGGIWKSSNHGDDWYEVNNGAPPFVSSLLGVSSQNIYAGSWGNVHKTTNGGNNWYPASTGLPTDNEVRVLAKDSGSNIYAGTSGGGIYKTSNNGANWYAINIGITNLNISSLAIESNSVFYAGVYGGPDILFKTTNSGNSWFPIGTLAGEITSLLVTSPGNVYAGTSINRIYKTTNGGNNWSQTYFGGKTVSSLAKDSASAIYFGSSGGGVEKTTNSGTNWFDLSAGLPNTMVSTVYYMAPYIFTGNQGASVSRGKEDAPTVTSISPNIGKNNEIVNVTIGGTNIATFGTVQTKLYKSGQFISGTNVNVLGANSLVCKFNLTGATLGVYDVKVINPDSQMGVLSSGLTVQESEKPTGSITIDNGALFCHSTAVNLSLQATDNVGVTQMMIANDSSFSGASWQSFSQTKAWTIVSGDGVKTVFVKYKDAAGNISDICSDTIELVTQKTSSRLAGETRYETATAISQKGWTTSDKIVLARGDLFPDALAGATLAAKYEAPILLTNPGFLTSSTKDEIIRLKTKEAFILGSEDALSEQVVTDLQEKCSVDNAKIHRYGGETRYETARDIAKQLSSPANKTAIIATGENYPDALASASVAAYKGMPILLVRGDISLIPASTKQALEDLGIQNLAIMGGADVVPQSIQSDFEKDGYKCTRYSGDTRYETCVAIANWSLGLGMGTDVIALAVGENFPDALTVGPLAAANRAPIVLVREFVPTSIENWVTLQKGKVYTLYIAGGDDVVSEDVVNKVKSLAGM